MKFISLFEQFYHAEISMDYIESIAAKVGTYGVPQRAVVFTHESINRFLQKATGKGAVILYRTLKLRSLDDLNKERLGLHYRQHNSVNDDFYSSIEIEDYDDYDDNTPFKLFNFTVEVALDDIDINGTIEALLNYPTEDEITLNSDAITKILHVEDYGNMSDFL